MIIRHMPRDIHVTEASKSKDPIRPLYFNDQIDSSNQILLNNDSSKEDQLSEVLNPYKFEIDNVDDSLS